MELARADDARFDTFRSPSIQTLRMAFAASGKVVAMDANGDTQTQIAPERPTQARKQVAKQVPKKEAPAASLVPSIIVGIVVAAVAGLSMWYLVRGEPLLVQGEVDATRLDIAARVDGRVAGIPVERGQDVAAGAVLVRIDNPETVAKNEQALAARVVADAQLANINAGTRAEVIAARKAALERAQASLVLAQQTYDRTRQLAEGGNAPRALAELSAPMN